MISGLFQTIAELVGEWYFERGPGIEIDCAYPCDSTCHNIIPSNQVCSILEEFFFNRKIQHCIMYHIQITVCLQFKQNE